MAPLDDMLDHAKRLEPDPPRSKLDDHAEVIWELRRKRKRVRTIANFLHEHGIEVHPATVARWLKAHPVPRSLPATKLPTAEVATPKPKLWPAESAPQRGGSAFFDKPTDPTNHEENR